MSSFTFEYKWVFILIPLFWICIKRCPAKNIAIYMPYINVLMASKFKRNLWVEILRWLGVIMLITALASPVVVTTYKNIKSDSRNITLIVDSSTSMYEKGFDEKNLLKEKFNVVMQNVKDFVDKRKGDRIGIITFADIAFIASPLTLDKEYLTKVIDRQKIGIAGKYTAIYDALLQSLYMLDNSKAKSKIAILLTDGEDTKSTTTYKDIKKVLQHSKVKLYIIGVSEEKINTEKLNNLAIMTGGEFYQAKNRYELSKIYNKIDKLETTKSKSSTYKTYHYYYFFPLIFAIVFLILYIYMKSIKGITK